VNVVILTAVSLNRVRGGGAASVLGKSCAVENIVVDVGTEVTVIAEYRLVPAAVVEVTVIVEVVVPDYDTKYRRVTAPVDSAHIAVFLNGVVDFVVFHNMIVTAEGNSLMLVVVDDVMRNQNAYAVHGNSGRI